MPYLRTIAESSECIRCVVEAEDGSIVGLAFADLLTLKRYSTGLGWIAANPDEEERVRMENDMNKLIEVAKAELT